MRVLISGATGLVGTELKRQLLASGHTPISLVRGREAGANEIRWNPSAGELPLGSLEDIDAVVNLGGATTGKIPWTKAYKQEIIASRLDSTRTLVQAINAAKNPPKVLVSGSASGFYGDSGDAILTEDSPKGVGFLADLAAQWEVEARKAKTRVVLVRTTMVMSRKLGALGRLLPLLRLGVGGALGNGRQWWAWISLPDEARAIIHLINHSDAAGAYNLTAPEPATCGQIVKSLARQRHRPAFLNVPAFALRLLLGEAAVELLLCSQNMSAKRLLATGFEFEHPTLESATAWVVGRD